jgi:hypothetical protein
MLGSAESKTKRGITEFRLDDGSAVFSLGFTVSAYGYEPKVFCTYKEAMDYINELPGFVAAEIKRNGWNDWKTYAVKANPPTGETEAYENVKLISLGYMGTFFPTFGTMYEDDRGNLCDYEAPYLTDAIEGQPKKNYLMIIGLKCAYLVLNCMLNLSNQLREGLMPVTEPQIHAIHSLFVFCAIQLKNSEANPFWMSALWHKIKNPEQLRGLLNSCRLSTSSEDMLAFCGYTPNFHSILTLTEEKLTTGEKEHIKYLECLLEFGVDISASLDKHGNFLHQAIANELTCIPIIRILNGLTANKFDFTKTDAAGNTPLMIAILTRHAGNALALIAAMSKKRSLGLNKNIYGWDELDVAITLGLPDLIVKQLMTLVDPKEDKKYASEYPEDIAIKMLASVYTSYNRQESEDRSIASLYQHGILCTKNESGEFQLLVRSKENSEVIASLVNYIKKARLEDKTFKPVELEGPSVLEACKIGYQMIKEMHPGLFVSATGTETVAYAASAGAGGGTGAVAPFLSLHDHTGTSAVAGAGTGAVAE